MKTRLISILSRCKFLSGLIFLPLLTFSQGSGDAGMWTSGDFDSRSRPTDTPSRIYLLQKAGLGNDKAICLTSEFQLDWNVWGGINLWFAVPYQYTTGELTAVHGLGDMRVAISHTLAETGDFVVKINVGGVIPSGYSDAQQDNKPLPMVYQVSQGSASFLVSAMFYLHGWNLSAGYQRPVSGNKNNFTRAAWGEDPLVESFPDSPALWCGDDLSFRLRKDFDRPKAQYTLGVLPAFRLSEDRIMVDGRRMTVEGSAGFSLNASAGMELRLGSYGYFYLLAAAPLVKRDVYTDGLDRDVVLMVGFGVKFPE